MERISSDKIMSFISTLAGEARGVEDKIHVAAVSTLDHIRESGDYRGAVALLNALPKGTRVQGLAAWYRHFSNGKMTLRQDQSKVWVCALKERTDADFDMAGAEATTFADLTNEVAPKQTTLEMFIKMLERTSTNDKSITVEGREVPKVTSAARALAAQFVAEARKLQAA